MRCELISWARVTRLAGSLAGRIQSSGFHPDRIVAIARGGYVPARLLCDRLNLYELDSIRIAHYRAGASRLPKVRLVSPLVGDISDLDVLLVDDVADTGDTLDLAVAYLQGLGARSVKVAVLQHKRQSPFIPDYCAEEVKTWRWLIYPWAVIEDLSGFLSAMSPAPRTAEELVERFRIEHGLKLPARLAAEVLAIAWVGAPARV
jgi:hypoxanthine phosphoribosyltransferase